MRSDLSPISMHTCAVERTIEKSTQTLSTNLPVDVETMSSEAVEMSCGEMILYRRDTPSSVDIMNTKNKRKIYGSVIMAVGAFFWASLGAEKWGSQYFGHVLTCCILIGACDVQREALGLFLLTPRSPLCTSSAEHRDTS